MSQQIIHIDDNDHDSQQPLFLEAQHQALQRFERQRQEREHDSVLEHLSEDESAALAAAIAASAQDEELRQQEERQRNEQERQQRVQEEEQRRRRSLEEQELLARQLQRQEEDEADQELAAAMEASAQDAHVRENTQQLEVALNEVQHKRQRECHDGSWHCLQCTFDNAPYAPLCHMCQSKPPDNTLVFQDIPESTKFGVELELIITDGKRDGYKLEWLAKKMTELGPPSVEYLGYSHETVDHWKIVSDSSLRGHTHHDLCLELVSPVLRGSEGLAQLRVLMEHVRQLGIATNKTCGFHVHVDATNSTLQELKRICQCFVALENAFDLLVAGNHRSTDQNQYCRSNRIAFGRFSNRQRWEGISAAQSKANLVNLMNPNSDRYRKLNLTNLTNPGRPSTVEFRLHGGVEELRQAEAWVRLIVRFCHRAAASAHNAINDNTSTSIARALTQIQTLREEATPKEELEALWQLMECPGLEQFYVMQHRLYQQKQLQNTWRCRKCRKPFETSRALSQHAEATGH